MGITGTFEGYASSPLYLFNNGTWSNLQTTGFSVTGGDGNGTVSGSSEILLSYSARGNRWCNFRSNQAFSLSGYKYFKTAITRTYEQPSVSDGSGDVKLGFSTNTSLSTANPSLSAVSSQGKEGTRTVIIDIGSLNGNYFFYICGYNAYSGSSRSYVKTTIKTMFLSNS